MAVIGFKDKHSWVVAGWAYRQALEDIISHCEDSKVAAILKIQIETDGIIVDFLEPELSARVTQAIKQVAEGILSGAIRSSIYDKSYGDEHRVREYVKGLQELLQTIP